MYKLLLIMLLATTTLFAAQVKWAKDFKHGIETAKKEKKPVLLLSQEILVSIVYF